MRRQGKTFLCPKTVLNREKRNVRKLWGFAPIVIEHFCIRMEDLRRINNAASPVERQCRVLFLYFQHFSLL